MLEFQGFIEGELAGYTFVSFVSGRPPMSAAPVSVASRASFEIRYTGSRPISFDMHDHLGTVLEASQTETATGDRVIGPLSLTTGAHYLLVARSSANGPFNDDLRFDPDGSSGQPDSFALAVAGVPDIFSGRVLRGYEACEFLVRDEQPIKMGLTVEAGEPIVITLSSLLRTDSTVFAKDGSLVCGNPDSISTITLPVTTFNGRTEIPSSLPAGTCELAFGNRVLAGAGFTFVTDTRPTIPPAHPLVFALNGEPLSETVSPRATSSTCASRLSRRPTPATQPTSPCPSVSLTASTPPRSSVSSRHRTRQPTSPRHSAESTSSMC